MDIYGKVVYVEQRVFARPQSEKFLTLLPRYDNDNSEGIELYRHYGVGISNSEIIHFSDPNWNPSTACIRLISVEEFSSGKEIKECKKVYYKFDAPKVVSRARSMLGKMQGEYDLLKNNCEHFANWCANDENISYQVFFQEDAMPIKEKFIANASDKLDEFGDKVEKSFDKAIRFLDDIANFFG